MERDQPEQAKAKFSDSISRGRRGPDLQNLARTLVGLQTEEADQDALNRWMLDNWPADGPQP